MGNRAVITTERGWSNPRQNLGIYLHWNGGRDSVEGFLTYCKFKGYRSPESDNYGWASLATVITNFFGADGLSIGIDVVSQLPCSNSDNGVYIIKDWEIVDRKHFKWKVEQAVYELEDVLNVIDETMPTDARLGREKIKELLEARNAE